MLKLFTGGSQAKAGEWFLEIHRVLFEIYQTFYALETFLNRGDEELYVGEEKRRVEVDPATKLWLYGYMVDNGYLRIGSALDKIAQMSRVYFEHPDNGGPLSLSARCGKCDPDVLKEQNCSFGNLLHALRGTTDRNAELQRSLLSLDSSDTLGKVKKARNDIVHRLNKKAFLGGLDPAVTVEREDGIETTTFTLGSKAPDLNEYRLLIAAAYNELIDQLNIIGPIVFPAKTGT
jgi:hypothetical protein